MWSPAGKYLQVPASRDKPPMRTTSISFKTGQVNGFKLYYREAGDPQEPAGAGAFRRDDPCAKVVFLGSRHVALETHAAEIGEIRAFSSTIPKG
jgi:hypothetical protein